MTPPLRSQTESHPSTTASSGHLPRSILVIDDERSIVTFLYELLEGEGYDVVRAWGGNQALSILRTSSPELVISDVVMPHASGHDVIRYIGSIPHKSAPKVILMSAELNRSPRKHIPLLHKPFDVEELLELVDDAFDEPAVG